MNTSVVFCCLLLALAYPCDSDRATTKDERDAEARRLRYVKDDGVEKIVLEQAARAKENNAKNDGPSIAEDTGDTTKPVDFREIIKTKDVPRFFVTEKSAMSNQGATTDKISRLKDLEKSLRRQGGQQRFSSSEEMRIKERRLIPLEHSESSGSVVRALNQPGVPFYIAEDGKSIQLPESDVIYNEKTGEILIRNRATDKMKKEEQDATITSNDRGADSVHGFNIQHNGAGLKNLHGFVIAETDDDSKIGSSYANTALKEEPKIQDTKIMEDNGENNISTSSIRKSKQQTDESKTTNDEKNATDMTSEVVKDNRSPMTTHNLQDQPITSQTVPEHYSGSTPATQDDSETTKSHMTNEIKNVEMAENGAVDRYSYAESNRNGKQATGKSNDRNYEVARGKDATDALDQIYNNQQAPARSNEEPTYKFPLTPEGIRESKLVNGGFDTPAESLAPAVVDGEEPIAPSESFKESGNDYEAVKADLVVRPNVDIPPASISNEDISRRLGELDPIDDTNAQSFVTTTTEKPDPLAMLRIYLEDIYLRGPVAIVVDVEPRNLMRTRDLWTTMEAEGGILNITDAVLFGYDADGITSMSYHKGAGANRVDTDSKSLAKALYGMTTTSKYYKGPGNPRVALTKAAQLLPYDSAIFLFEMEDRDVQQGTPQAPKLIKQLLTKRIKLYSVSDGSAWSSGPALASGGAALSLDAATLTSHTRPQLRELRALSVYYDASDEEELVYDDRQTVLMSMDTDINQPLPIPVDSSIKTLHISIGGIPDMAILRGPEGVELDLNDATSVESFSTGSKKTTASSPGPVLQSTLVLAKSDPQEEELMGKPEPFRGIWKLTLFGNSTYTVNVTAETNLRIMAKLIHSYTDKDNGDGSLKIAVGGSVASVREAEIVGGEGQPIGKLVYKYNEDEDDAPEVEALRALESGTVVRRVKLPEGLDPGTAFRVRVAGRNDRDEQFVRISSPLVTPAISIASSTESEFETIDPKQLDQSEKLTDASERQTLARGLGTIDEGRAYNSTPNGQQVLATQDAVPMTVIQIGTASRLYGVPGAQMQIHFEVTNNRDNAVYFRFGAKDEKYFLRSLVPVRQWINARQTANVVLTVGITSNTETNSRDTITFTANGLEPVVLNVYFYVESEGQIASDRSRPSLRHEFRGDCLGYLDSDSCSKRNWALDIIAKDTDSGLMRIAASPGVVAYQPSFYAGSRDESWARYTASCCTQAVVISATDVAGNLASYEINVSQYFTPATIAAIVLAVLLFVVLIVVIGLLIRMCVRRRRASRDLPSYQTQRVT